TEFNSSSPHWLVCLLLSLSAVHTHAKDALIIPQQVSLLPNVKTQELSISWLGGSATTFDLLILRTEFNVTVFYETVSVMVDQASGRHQFNWTSAEPLECTSLSIKVRSRDGERTSDWSNTEILQGSDEPSNGKFRMYPQDKVVSVGTNTTFCCIVEEGQTFRSIHYISTLMNVTRLSRRTYATTVFHQGPSGSTGNNAYCQDTSREKLTGTVVFVGYPPLLTDFVCETHDLSSTICQWNISRDTHLYGRRATRYFINGRYDTQKQCSLEGWKGNWTLVAQNVLGEYSLSDSAELSYRVHPVAPELLSVDAHARNATALWEWKYSSYSTLALVCQIELSSTENKTKRTFSGVGLRSVVLLDLYPYEAYSVKVRCGAQQNFWKWGNWSKTFSFKTKIDVPDVLDVWVWMNKDNTGHVIWKPLTPKQSHGPITNYEVTIWSPEENVQHTEIISQNTWTAPINLTRIPNFSSNMKVIVTVVATNPAGVSQPASVIIPRHFTDVDLLAASKVAYTDGGFPLFWKSDANSSCGYVVQWNDAFCTRDCPVEWTKVAPGNNNISIESRNFQAGVRYVFSVYSCSTEAPELLQRWQGYMQELVPSSSVQLSTTQQNSDILITWDEIPLAKRRGYLLGYNVYISNGSQLTLLADWLILEILASLGVTALFLVIATFICYKKRKCMVHIVEKPGLDSSKEMLVVIPEEDEDEEGQGIGDEPVDTDEPTSLRYYNQVVDDRPIMPRYPDSSASSASSLDSGRTDVTYTGIQTSGSSLVFQLDPQGTAENQQPQAGAPVSCGGVGGGYRPQMHPQPQSDNLGLTPSESFTEPEAAISGGYRPQGAWHLDSPEEAEECGSLAPSLGSPTSIASTQFLLPDGSSDEHAEERHQTSSSAATWFTNLLSSTKP
uniref:Leukemia inhibitory factor receptor-like n=1 Tax=Sphaeramia orbicularis TaxID=375764 RepID=A0A672YUC5_9TELE